MKFVALIPSRYASTRFPGKPLALLGGKPIVQWVYETTQSCFDATYVATDNEEIYNCVTSFGGKAIMTSSNHKSGTDRIHEAYNKLKEKYDVVVNVQGDEPFVAPQQLELLKTCFTDPETAIATLVKPFEKGCDWNIINNPNTPKVVMDNKMHALYFSRSVIPYIRGKEQSEWSKSHQFYKHLGIYAYRSEVLQTIAQLPPSELELAESLEQLRWLQAGYTIKVGITDIETVGIDTPEDLVKAESLLSNKLNMLK